MADSPAKSPKGDEAAASKSASPPPGPAAAGEEPAADPAPAALAPLPDPDAPIEVDPNLAGPGESDDGYETDSANTRASTSLSSSVRDYSFENSRRYHKFKEGTYQFPNDEPEQEREDMKHAMILHLCKGRLHLAPLESPQAILDVGTGTGIWAIDMGDEYPSADILGVDLSPIQPVWVPPNVRFIVDDVEAAWVQPPDSLDYIHVRGMGTAIKDFPRLMEQAYAALKPGGYLELQDIAFEARCDDGTMGSDYSMTRFTALMKEAMAKFGVNIVGPSQYAQQLQSVGFTDVDEQIMKLPIGVWPRDRRMKVIGLYNRSVIYDGLQGIAMAPFTRALGWTMEEVEVFLVEMRRGLMDPSTHSYFPFYDVIARKPLHATGAGSSAPPPAADAAP